MSFLHLLYRLKKTRTESSAGDLEKPFLMPIEGLCFFFFYFLLATSKTLEDVFSISGRGTVATGRVCF